MEDRRAWIKDEAVQLSKLLKIKPPRIVFEEHQVMGMRFPIRAATTEITDENEVRELGEPELRISPWALENRSEGEMRYRLARVLLSTGALRPLEQDFAIAAMTVFSVGLLVGLLAGKLSHSLLLGIVAGVLGGVFAFGLLLARDSMRSRSLQRKAVELTGEFEGACEAIRFDAEQAPDGTPPAAIENARKGAEREIQSLRTAANRRNIDRGSDRDRPA